MTMSPAPAVGTAQFSALGTSASLLVTDPGGTDRARALLRAELDAIDRACSRFRPDSELWRVNNAHGRAMRVSALLAEAVAVALAAADVTDGDVDPTCGGSLMRLGYDRDFAVARRDTSPLPQPAVPAAGWQAVELDRGRRKIKLPGEVTLDLGATAKALAADRAAARIAAALRCGALVNLGGDIAVAGGPPEQGWLVGIAGDQEFDGPGDAPRHDTVVTIRDGGLATSSTRVRAWSRGTARLHHIIDPSTGMPASSCWCTVSVAAASCVAANTASTAAIIRGERAPGWLAGQHLPARLAGHSGEIVTVAGWPADITGEGSHS
jgi:FAD:protein FMN transferase